MVLELVPDQAPAVVAQELVDMAVRDLVDQALADRVAVLELAPAQALVAVAPELADTVEQGPADLDQVDQVAVLELVQARAQAVAAQELVDTAEQELVDQVVVQAERAQAPVVLVLVLALAVVTKADQVADPVRVLAAVEPEQADQDPVEQDLADQVADPARVLEAAELEQADQDLVDQDLVELDQADQVAVPVQDLVVVAQEPVDMAVQAAAEQEPADLDLVVLVADLVQAQAAADLEQADQVAVEQDPVDQVADLVRAPEVVAQEPVDMVAQVAVPDLALAVVLDQDLVRALAQVQAQEVQDAVPARKVLAALHQHLLLLRKAALAETDRKVLAEHLPDHKALLVLKLAVRNVAELDQLLLQVRRLDRKAPRTHPETDLKVTVALHLPPTPKRHRDRVAMVVIHKAPARQMLLRKAVPHPEMVALNHAALPTAAMDPTHKAAALVIHRAVPVTSTVVVHLLMRAVSARHLHHLLALSASVQSCRRTRKMEFGTSHQLLKAASVQLACLPSCRKPDHQSLKFIRAGLRLAG